MTTEERKAWFAQFAAAAQESQRRCGIPACVVLAQAYIESADQNGNAGQSKLAREDNNYFGIKARAGEAYCEHKTKEFVTVKVKAGQTVAAIFAAIAKQYASEGVVAVELPPLNPNLKDPLTPGAVLHVGVFERAHFRKFATVHDSFVRHGELISKNPRYAPAMAAADDPIVFAAKLQACGYSTNANYAEMIAEKINRYALRQYDLKPTKAVTA